MAMLRRLVLLAFCAPVALSCSGEDANALHFGGMFSATGPLAEVGFAQLSAARVAVEQINDAGGLLGKRLVLVYRDDGADPAKTDRAANALLVEDVPVVIGSVSSATTLQAAKLFDGKAVQISASATSPEITGFADQGYLFRTCASEAGEGRLLAARALGKARFRAAIVRRAGDSERGLADGFTSYYERSALASVVGEREYVQGQESYASLVNDVMALEPGAILLDADPVSGAQIVRDFLSLYRGSNVLWLFSHSVQSTAFVAGVGSRAFGFPHEGVGPAIPAGRRYTTFAAAYESRYGSQPPPGAFAANAYDAVMLAALAVAKAGDATPEAVQNYLGDVSQGGTAYGPDDISAALQAASEKKDVNYEGASGAVDLDALGDTKAPYDVWQVKEGQISVVAAAQWPN